MNDRPELDSFDRALLTELRHTAAQRRHEDARRSRVRPLRRRIVAGGVGVAGVAATVLGVSALNPAAAYTVKQTPTGTVVIRIHQLRDSPGLERALARDGITAHVDYRASATTDPSMQPTLTDLHQGDASGTTSSSVTSGGATAGSSCGGLQTMPLSTSLRGHDLLITIPQDSVLHHDNADLKIQTAGSLHDHVAGLNVSFTLNGQNCRVGTISAEAAPH